MQFFRRRRSLVTYRVLEVGSCVCPPVVQYQFGILDLSTLGQTAINSHLSPAAYSLVHRVASPRACIRRTARRVLLTLGTLNR